MKVNSARLMPRKRVDELLTEPFADRAVYFREYTGRRPKSDWNRKPIVGPPDRPFAELQMVERLERSGWTAGWCFKAGQFISRWNPPQHVLAELPDEALALIERIRTKAGAKAGCWDVFAWKDGRPLFVELKRSGSSDRMRESQKRWRKAAEALGVSRDAFKEYEWLGGSLDGYSIKALSRLGVDVQSWVRYRDGRFEFGGSNPKEAEAWVKHYRQVTGLRGADVLWVLFRDNTSGVTCWDIKQSRAATKRS